MTQVYMVTMPYERGIKRALKVFIEVQDIHRWAIGLETGKSGYRHVQARFEGRDGFFEAFTGMFPKAHVEKASDTWEYERKEGRYWTSEDTDAIRAVRFGKMRPQQKSWLDACRKQGDRGITTVYDPSGCHGKSWLCVHLWETRQACYVPPTVDTVKGMIQWVASAYRGERYILIDIPRSWKWSDQLYTAIESIKDGLVYDTRYSAKCRDIRGAYILIMTNTMPKLDKLSADRWHVIQVGGGSLS